VQSSFARIEILKFGGLMITLAATARALQRARPRDGIPAATRRVALELTCQFPAAERKFLHSC
jgi:hypothetical protein